MLCGRNIECSARTRIQNIDQSCIFSLLSDEYVYLILERLAWIPPSWSMGIMGAAHTSKEASHRSPSAGLL